jgi:AbrB family looped-hinge helix DNA binding protein
MGHTGALETRESAHLLPRTNPPGFRRSRGNAQVFSDAYIFGEATTVKLQKIGNSIRAAIPKEVADSLGLKPGEEMVVDATQDTVLLKKRRVKNLSDLYGVLRRAEDKVEHWPTQKKSRISGNRLVNYLRLKP